MPPRAPPGPSRRPRLQLAPPPELAARLLAVPGARRGQNCLGVEHEGQRGARVRQRRGACDLFAWAGAPPPPPTDGLPRAVAPRLEAMRALSAQRVALCAPPFPLEMPTQRDHWSMRLRQPPRACSARRSAPPLPATSPRRRCSAPSRRRGMRASTRAPPASLVGDSWARRGAPRTSAQPRRARRPHPTAPRRCGRRNRPQGRRRRRRACRRVDGLCGRRRARRHALPDHPAARRPLAGDCRRDKLARHGPHRRPQQRPGRLSRASARARRPPVPDDLPRGRAAAAGWVAPRGCAAAARRIARALRCAGIAGCEVRQPSSHANVCASAQFRVCSTRESQHSDCRHHAREVVGSGRRSARADDGERWRTSSSAPRRRTLSRRRLWCWTSRGHRRAARGHSPHIASERALGACEARRRRPWRRRRHRGGQSRGSGGPL